MREDGPVLFVLPEGKAREIGDQRVSEIAEALGPDVEVRKVDSPDEVPDCIARRAGSVSKVAIGGGDGTMSTAAAALMETRLPAIVVPLGTANDLARTLGLPVDPVAAAALARDGRVEDIDVGEVNGHYFFNAASVGISVDVAERLKGGRKALGPLSYLLALSDIVRARRSFRARITTEDDEVVVRSIQVTVGNGVRHGGGVQVHREASIDDGWLDLYSLEPQPGWRLIALLPSLLRGAHDAWRSVATMHGREILLETPDKPKRVNADGEIVTLTPAHFRLHRNAVLVHLPE